MFLPPLDVVLSHYDVVEPDLSAEDGDTLSTPFLPGCAFALRELFRASA